MDRGATSDSFHQFGLCVMNLIIMAYCTEYRCRRLQSSFPREPGRHHSCVGLLIRPYSNSARDIPKGWSSDTFPIYNQGVHECNPTVTVNRQFGR